MITFRHYLFEFNANIPTRRLPDQADRDDFVKRHAEPRFNSQFGNDGQFRPAYTKPGFRPMVTKQPRQQEVLSGAKPKPDEPALPKPPGAFRQGLSDLGQNIKGNLLLRGRHIIHQATWGTLDRALGLGIRSGPTRPTRGNRAVGRLPRTGRTMVASRPASRFGSIVRALGRGTRR